MPERTITSRRTFLAWSTALATEAVILTNTSPATTNAINNYAGATGLIINSAKNLIKNSGHTIENMAISTPLVTTVSSKDDLQRYVVYPGSLEDRALLSIQEDQGPEAGLKFIDPKNEGPLGLIKGVTFSKYNPKILEFTQRAIAGQWARIDRDERSSGAKLYIEAYRRSLAYITSLEKANLVKPDTNILVEADHWANYIVAATTAPHYSVNEGKLIGMVPRSAPDDLNVPYWFFTQNGYGRKGNPIIYGVENPELDLVEGEPFEQGTERWAHLAYHAFIASSYKYFHSINHPLKDSSPAILRAGITYGKNEINRSTNKRVLSSLDDEALFFSQFMGWLYEVKTTISEEHGQLDSSIKAAKRRFLGIGNYYANEGLTDTRVMEDIWANALGAALGLAKRNAILNGQDPEKVITQIDELKFKWTGNGQKFLIPVGAAA